MRFPLIGVAFASVFLLATGEVRAEETNTARLKPAEFAPAAGWHLLKGTVHACPGVSSSRCAQVTSAASTTRLRDCVECLPHRTVAAMSTGDIAIKITIAVERPLRAQRTLSWPPRVNRSAVVAGFEGLPSRISVYQGTTLVGTHEVSVFIFFGRPRPTDRQLKRTNAELRRARLS